MTTALRRLLALLLFFAMIGVACGDDDDGDAADTGGEDSDATQPAPTEVAVTAKEETPTKYAFEVPESLEEGGLVRFSFSNMGKQPHDFQVLEVDDGTTDEQLEKFYTDVVGGEGSPTPSFVHAAGGVGSTNPGSTGRVVQVLAAGDYAFFCTFSDDEPEGDGPPAGTHAAKGMKGRFTVGGDAAGTVEETDSTVEAREYGFTVDGLKAGENQITFTNTGKELHHFNLFPMLPGKTIEDVKQVFASESEPTGPPPIDFEKGVGVAVIEEDVSTVNTLTLAAGSYAMVCFISDRAGGPPHFTQGMLQEVKVG